jgi:hypothetical protein
MASITALQTNRYNYFLQLSIVAKRAMNKIYHSSELACLRGVAQLRRKRGHMQLTERTAP